MTKAIITNKIAVAVAVGLVALMGVLTATAQQSASATRSFDSATVAPGADVTVTIDVANYGGLGRVTETLPDGFTYKSSSLDDFQVDASRGQEVRFTLQGDSSFTYVVTASSTAGPYTFSGALRDSDRQNHPVGGATRVTVQAPPSGSGPSATRSFSSTSVAPGADVTVTIRATNYGGFGRVTETLPNGFTYKSSSLDNSKVDASGGQEVRFTLQGDSSFTYVVTASSTAGGYDFSGELRDSDRNNHTVGGATRVTVQAPPPGSGPTATRSFSSTSVDPGADVTVTIALANYGGFGRVTETLPNGFTYKSSSFVNGEVDASGGQTVIFTLLQGETSFTYVVAAPDTAGSYTFSGELRDSDTDDHTIGGDSQVTVQLPAGPASRSLPSRVSPNGTVTVTIRAANYGGFGRVTETLPDGFTYKSSSLDDSQVDASRGQEVRFTLQGDTSFTYTVTAPGATGAHEFVGTFTDSDRENTGVGGQSRIQVRRPSTGGGGGGGGGGGTGGGGGSGGDSPPPATATPPSDPPIIPGGLREEFSVPENTTAVASLTVVDGRRVTWSIDSGFDADRFSIGAENGELVFKVAPDFENPTDLGANNEYIVLVRAAESERLYDTQTILVTVLDVDEDAPTPTPAPTATPTPMPTATPTPAPTATPTPMPTATPTTPAPTATATTPAPTATATPVPTATPTTPAPTATATTAPTPEPTDTPVPTDTAVPPVPTPTAEVAPTPVAPEEEEGFPVWAGLLLILAVLVVAGAVVVYIRSRR